MTRITATDDRHVTLTYTDELGDEITREFWAPRVEGSAYVCEGDRQVCDYLATRGSPLMVGPATPLVSVIRREWQRARAAERRELAR